MVKFTRSRNYALMAGIVFAATLLSYTAIAPASSQALLHENGITPGPSPEEQPYIVESENAFPWPPIGLPSTGNPQMQITELQTKPESFNKINLAEAQWLQNAIGKQNQRVSMSQESVAEYFSYYKKVNNHNGYFEVTFPDGSVRYYNIIYTEVP